MLHEAYYPSELSDNRAIKIFYGFNQGDVSTQNLLTLVVFYPKLTGTSLFNLSDKIKSNLALFLLNKHVFGVVTELVKVAFICPHLNDKDFYGELFEINLIDDYFHEVNENIKSNYIKKYGSIIGKILSKNSYITQTNSRNLTVGSTSKIRLVNRSNISIERAEELLKSLKTENFGDFNRIFGDSK